VFWPEVIGYFTIKVGTLKEYWKNCRSVACYWIGNSMSMMPWKLEMLEAKIFVYV